MPDFESVVTSWDVADPDHIHPLRGVDNPGYWASGESQAAEAMEYIPDGGTVMDFGCGEGRVAIPLARAGYQVVAVDASRKMLERLRDNAPDIADDKIRLVQSDGMDLALMEPVDVVVCRSVLIHHSHRDVALLVQAFADVIKPGGFLVADWPKGGHHERIDWIDVTTWDEAHRLQVGNDAGFVLLVDSKPTVWRRI